MKNSKIFYFAAVIFLIIVSIAAALMINSKSSDNVQISAQTTVSSSKTEKQANVTVENVTENKQSVTSVSKAASAIEKASAEDKNLFIKNGLWYLFDDENTVCYVFSFGDNKNVDLAIFNQSNINGEDPQYFEGYSTYEINSNILKVKIPASFDKNEQKILKIKNKNLYFDNIKLENHKDLKMDYVLNHFE